MRARSRERKFFYGNADCKRKTLVDSSGRRSYGTIDKEREVPLWQESRTSIRTACKDQ